MLGMSISNNISFIWNLISFIVQILYHISASYVLFIVLLLIRRIQSAGNYTLFKYFLQAVPNSMNLKNGTWMSSAF